MSIPRLHTQVRLRTKLSDVTSGVKSFFSGGAAQERDPAVVKLEELKVG
jgi:hypothetical protein